MARDRLPNAPLGEVVFELRFPGELSLYSAWGGIQEDVHSEFPKLLVPKIADGDFAALKPFHLSSEDDSERLTLAVNSFAFITRKYPEFGGFRARYQHLLDIFIRHVRPRHLTRVGLRYLNWLPNELPGVRSTPRQVHPALKIEVSGLPALEVAAPPVFIGHLRHGQSVLTIQIGQEGAGTRLDLDCFQQATMPVDRVMATLDEVHALIERSFFDIVTDEYLAYMKGGTP